MESDVNLLLLKSRMFDIWNEHAFSHDSSAKWFEDLRIILTEFFDINESDYYINDTNTFVQVNWDNSFFQLRKVIHWKEIEGFFFEKNFAEIPFIGVGTSSQSSISILLRENTEVLGLLTLEVTDKFAMFTETPYINEFITSLTKLVRTIRKSIYLSQQEHQYRNLFNITKKFHSTLEIGDILEGTLFAVKDAFPAFQSTLILSNDQDRKTSVPYKLFDFTTERPATVEAFVSGEITSELAEDLVVRLLNVPIKGKQGIYGVLRVSTPLDYLFSTRQKEFITMLANTAGNALENAKLYIQSHRLVADLQLINETSQKLNMNLSIQEMIAFLTKQLMKSFHPEQACFVFIEGEDYHIYDGTEYFYTLDGQMYIQHVGNHFKKQKDSLFVADFNRMTGLTQSYRSLIAIPLREQNTIVGFSIVMHSEPYYFSFDSFKLMQSLIQHSSLAISNSTLRMKLQEMVDRDHLTNLYARIFLDKYVESSIETDQEGVFVLMDIDNFKQINDTYGHQTGDTILEQIAALIQRKVENIGIGARWGGEELALYFPNMTLDEGIEKCEELLEIIPLYTDPSVTVSIGLSSWTKDTVINYHHLFHNTDIALYEAKNNGKNQLCIFEGARL